MQDDRGAPVQMAIVLKVLCPMAAFDIFNHMGLEELSKQLQGLVAGYLRTKVVIVPQKIMQIIHSLGSREAAVIAAKVCPMPSKWHATTKKSDSFIPLHNSKTKNVVRNAEEWYYLIFNNKNVTASLFDDKLKKISLV